MKKQRGNPGLKGRLIEKSIEGYILALETINRLSIRYRVETFCYLICNAWELLFKAKLLNDSGNNRESIYRDKKKVGEIRKSISLRECLIKIFPDENTPERRNIECIAELRDESVHLVLSDVPTDILGVFQACVINYHYHLNRWFGMSLAETVNVGMMSIVYDLDPSKADLSNKRLRRELGKEAANYLSEYCARMKTVSEKLKHPAQFSIGVEYRLVLTKKPGDADIVLQSGADGDLVGIVEVPKDPSKTHPFRLKELLETLKDQAPLISFNSYDIQCVVKAHNIKNRSEFFYKGKVQGSPSQYSFAFIKWLIDMCQRDVDFIFNSRTFVKYS